VKQQYGKGFAQLEGEPEILKILQEKGADASRALAMNHGLRFWTFHLLHYDNKQQRV
jgi:hypothetical protein